MAAVTQCQRRWGFLKGISGRKLTARRALSSDEFRQRPNDLLVLESAVPSLWPSLAIPESPFIVQRLMVCGAVCGTASQLRDFRDKGYIFLTPIDNDFIFRHRRPLLIGI
jgi:hypothetical protein